MKSFLQNQFGVSDQISHFFQFESFTKSFFLEWFETEEKS